LPKLTVLKVQQQVVKLVHVFKLLNKFYKVKIHHLLHISCLFSLIFMENGDSDDEPLLEGSMLQLGNNKGLVLCKLCQCRQGIPKDTVHVD